MPATSGLDALVPPTTIQPPAPALNTATPVLGSATADTSAAARRVHAAVGTAVFWNAGLASTRLHVLPAPRHTVSVQPRVAVDRTRWVPPTAITCSDVLG